jgi:hypothetical protein
MAPFLCTARFGVVFEDIHSAELWFSAFPAELMA